MSVRHLLTVWNPSYSDDVLDTHLAVLLKWSAECDAGRVDQDEVFVWWAKIRSKNRDGQVTGSRNCTARVPSGIRPTLIPDTLPRERSNVTGMPVPVVMASNRTSASKGRGNA